MWVIMRSGKVSTRVNVYVLPYRTNPGFEKPALREDFCYSGGDADCFICLPGEYSDLMDTKNRRAGAMKFADRLLVVLATISLAALIPGRSPGAESPVASSAKGLTNWLAASMSFARAGALVGE